MALTLDKLVLDKIEALQNIMLASVTGGARDEAEYRQIRDELFRLPVRSDRGKVPHQEQRNRGTCLARRRQEDAHREDSRFRELALLRQLPTALLVFAGRCDPGRNATDHTRGSRKTKTEKNGRLCEMAVSQLY